MNRQNLSISTKNTTLPGLTRVFRDKKEILGHFCPRIFLKFLLSPRIVPCPQHPPPAKPIQVAALLSLCQKMSLTITTCIAGIHCRRIQRDKYVAFDDKVWTFSSLYQSVEGRPGVLGISRPLTHTRKNMYQRASSSTRIMKFNHFLATPDRQASNFPLPSRQCVD